MAGAAAGGFVARAFESMLKESSNKKHSALQSAIQTYFDSAKGINQQSNVAETKQVPSAASNQSGLSESGSGVETRPPSAAEGTEPTSSPSGSSGSITTSLANAGRTLGDTEAELVLNPLRLAFETKNLKLVELALDCLHKLIEYNHLEGVPGLDGGKNSKLLTDILNMICSSVDNSSPDSTTLQVLKVLLSAIASTKMRVHGEPLLGVIRVCCNIALNSKSPINQATSMATLTQMLSIIFTRIETEMVFSISSEHEVLSEGGSSNANFDEVSPRRTSDNVLSVSVIYNRPPASVEEIQNLVGCTDIKALEAALQKAMDREDDRKVERDMDTRRMSVEQLDALLVFHAICKMGMKEGNDENTTKTRTLSMELLQGLLDSVSDSFTKNYQFIDTVRAHLSYALLRASASQSAITFQHAMGTLSVILLRFRESLKVEIGVLFPAIVLRSLDGSDLNQKLSVLRMLEKLCKNPQMLVDLYINYDCDLEEPNLFEKMVTALSKVAQGTQIADPKSSTAQQVGSTKTSSLQGLVNALKSLIVWEKAHGKSEKQNKNKESSKEDVPSTESNESESRESMKFSGMKFEIAIREFLKGLRFPREAQRIDSLMEKFAERYCADNPGVFKNADTAYVLAYAIIMLNNDAHNPMVSSKMSRNDFFYMNTRNDAEESAPQELLVEIYDSIVKEEIKMTNDLSGNLENGSQNPEVEERRLLINILNLALPKSSSSTESKSEKDGIINKIQGLIKDQGGKGGVFYTSHRIELIYPMVEALAWPLLATFAVSMGEADDKSRTSLCMEGFKEGIRITHVLGMDTLRYAFLTSLLRYTSLHAPRDMRAKNIEALETVLALCDTEINALEDSWYAILECISRLEQMVSSPAMTETVMQGSPQSSRDATLQSLRELSGKPTEQVFINTIRLSSESVVEFFTALCSVSAEELKQTPPRIFSLYKVVEISYYNLDRIHMVWSRIWSILAQHFIFAGSHADESIAVYTIDSLRQLGTRYLEHPELVSFTFQNDILKPFAVLMQNSKSESIRRRILGCIVKMIKSKVEKFKSGWRSVFIIFTTAADDHLENIVESAFENVEQVILEHFNQVFEDCFMDCVNCLIGFANNKTSHSISLKAIALLRICEDRLAEGLVPGGSPKGSDIPADKACDLTECYWFPMLAGLSKLISDPRSEVRNCALEVLFDLLNVRGSRFSPSFWEKIFQEVLFPIFDHVRHAGTEGFICSGDEWFRESTVHALQLLCDLFNTFYKEVCFLLPPLLGLLLDCARKSDQAVVSISLSALVHLIEVGGHQFSEPDWDTLLKSIRDASYLTQPLELLNDLNFENGKHEKVLSADLDSPSPVSGDLSNAHVTDHNQETVRPVDTEGSEGMPSPSGRTTKPTDDGGLQRSQTLGQRIMGNMKDNLFVRTFSSKPKNITSDETVISSPSKIPDVTIESDVRDEEEESPTLLTIRCKCLTQLLLLGAIDSIQKKYWNKLNAEHKITMMEILFSVLEFAASYNSYANLRLRMHKIPAERPPLNLLRQELTGTCIYIDILQKTTAAVNNNQQETVKEKKLEGIAEEKLVSFCEQVLREASDFQSTMEETTNMDIHRVLELRSPVIVKVLKSMCEMNPHIFRNHLRDFYPPITKLVCCDQMEIRGALADLFSMQLSTLLA